MTLTIDQAAPVVMGAEGSHGTLRRVLASREPCRVLDAACGQGVLAQYLHELGWDVECADFFPELFKFNELPIRKADLNRRLPYDDAEFDVVVCANAIHRLFNPGGAAREFWRILKPGGVLFVNMNNYASIEARLRFLLYGSLDRRQWEEGLDPREDPEGNVRVRIMYPQLVQYLEAAGLQVERVMPAPPRLRHRCLAPAAALVALASSLIPAQKRHDNCMKTTNSRAILFGGYYVLIEARKSTNGEART